MEVGDNSGGGGDAPACTNQAPSGFSARSRAFFRPTSTSSQLLNSIATCFKPTSGPAGAKADGIGRTQHSPWWPYSSCLPVAERVGSGELYPVCKHMLGQVYLCCSCTTLCVCVPCHINTTLRSVKVCITLGVCAVVFTLCHVCVFCPYHIVHVLWVCTGLHVYCIYSVLCVCHTSNPYCVSYIYAIIVCIVFCVSILPCVCTCGISSYWRLGEASVHVSCAYQHSSLPAF